MAAALEPIDTLAQPHSLDAERAVLGAILLHEELYDQAAAVVAPPDFYRHAHGLIFAAMVALRTRNAAVDFLTVKEHLTVAGDLDAVGGPAYISDLASGIPRSINVEHYARVVKDKAVRRRLIAEAGKAIEAARHSTDDTADVIGQTQQAMFALAEGASGTGFATMAELVTEGMAALEQLVKTKGGVSGLPSGFPDLDAYTCGFQPSDLIIVAGRPGMGKTAFALNVAEHVGCAGRTVAVFSLEMSRQQLFLRMLSGHARVDSQRMKSGRLYDSDWGKLSHALESLGVAPILIDDTASIGVTEIGAKCRRLASERGLDLVVIDYLQLMNAEQGRNGNREQAIAQVSRSLKKLAKELRVPVIVLSQLSRATESRANHRPQLSDLRESGALEQDADVVLFPYRPEMYDDDPKLDAMDYARSDGTAEIIIGKQRSGPLGTVKVAYLKTFTRFESLASEAPTR